MSECMVGAAPSGRASRSRSSILCCWARSGEVDMSLATISFVQKSSTGAQ